MQINAIYTRSVIQTMAGKAIRDLRSGGERELRNVAKLCREPSAPPGYQQFWSLLEDLLHRPGQQYGALLSRAANDVDISCLKTLIANLGLHACTSGSQTLRDNWQSGASPAYWMEPVDGSLDPHALHQAVLALQQRGTSTFLLRAGRQAELDAILDLAAKHHQCVFFLVLRRISCCREQLENMTALGNVIPLIQCGDLPALSGPLKQAGLLFGFHRSYGEIHSLGEEDRLLRQCIARGCFLGVYEGTGPDCRENRELFYYAKLQELRQQGGREILLADLWRDRDVVQRLLLHQQTLPDCSWNGKAAQTPHAVGGERNELDYDHRCR